MADAGSEGREGRLPDGVQEVATQNRRNLGHGSSRCGSELGDPKDIGQRDAFHESQRGQNPVTRTSCPKLADAGRQLSQSEDVGGQPAVEESGAQKPIFALGPQDLDLWARVLAETPTLEPSFCRMADGVADGLEYRSDRLRLLGNGVVPLQAAVALRVLADRAGWKLN